MKEKLNEYGQTLDESFTRFLEDHYEEGVKRWSEEERDIWIHEASRDGFDPAEAGRVYDDEKARNGERGFEDDFEDDDA